MTRQILNREDHAKIDRVTTGFRFVVKAILVAWLAWLSFLAIISLMCVL